MTTTLATVIACSRRLQPRIYSILFSCMTNTTDGIHLTPIFRTRWRYRHPPPSPFPFSHSPIKPDIKGASMPVVQRLGWGRTQCDPLLLGEALPKIHTVGLSIPPAQNTNGGAPSLPYPTTPLTLWSPKPNYGQLTPKGHTWGVCFLHTPILGPWASDPKSKEFGGCNFGNPHFGPSCHLPFFAVLDS